jgi:hypothetical protein
MLITSSTVITAITVYWHLCLKASNPNSIRREKNGFVQCSAYVKINTEQTTVSSSHEQKQYREMRERKIISKFIYNCFRQPILPQHLSRGNFLPLCEYVKRPRRNTGNEMAL